MDGKRSRFIDLKRSDTKINNLKLFDDDSITSEEDLDQEQNRIQNFFNAGFGVKANTDNKN